MLTRLYSKRGVILIEAIVSMWIFLVLLVGLSYVYEKVHSFDNKVNEMLAYSTYTKVINSLEFVKNRSLSIWNEDWANWASQNIKYPGWTRLKVTSWSTQTLNDLNGSYSLTDTGCPAWLTRCLKTLAAGTFSEIPLASKFTLFIDDTSWNQVIKSSEQQSTVDLQWTCGIEYDSDCLWYRLDITDVVAGKNNVLSYVTSWWITETVKLKSVTTTITNWKNQKTYSYLLSVF